MGRTQIFQFQEMGSPVPELLWRMSCTANVEQRLWWFEYAWPMGSGIIRRCGLVEIGVALLEEVCYHVGRL